MVTKNEGGREGDSKSFMSGIVAFKFEHAVSL
jgi:hypothetical protein